MEFLFTDDGWGWSFDDDGDNPTDSVYATDDSRHPNYCQHPLLPDYDVDVTHPMVPDLIEDDE